MHRAMHNSVRWTTEEQNSLLYTMRGPWNWEAVNEMLIIGDDLDVLEHRRRIVAKHLGGALQKVPRLL